MELRLSKDNKRELEEAMSIQKKSLISTLKTAKKANFAKSEGEVKSEKQVSAVKLASPRQAISARSTRSTKRPNLRMNFKQIS